MRTPDRGWIAWRPTRGSPFGWRTSGSRADSTAADRARPACGDARSFRTCAGTSPTRGPSPDRSGGRRECRRWREWTFRRAWGISSLTGGGVGGGGSRLPGSVPPALVQLAKSKIAAIPTTATHKPPFIFRMIRTNWTNSIALRLVPLRRLGPEPLRDGLEQLREPLLAHGNPAPLEHHGGDVLPWRPLQFFGPDE